MLPRFDAQAFDGVTPDMLTAFRRDGILVLDSMADPQSCDALRARMDELLAGLKASGQRSVFSTVNQTHEDDRYFLESGADIRFFFEEEAFDDAGKLTAPFEQSINKVGHALHDADPVFSGFSRQPRFEALVRGLGHSDPLLLQSMYIFKQPKIGGEVVCHQDATYLRTEPESCIGVWVALEDATVENGCLWGIPGGHLSGGLRSAFRRAPDGDETWTETLSNAPFDEAARVPIEAPKGTVLAFSGLFPHLSCANRSAHSRHAYTLHVIDGSAHYGPDNWLRRPADMPLRGF